MGFGGILTVLPPIWRVNRVEMAVLPPFRRVSRVEMAVLPPFRRLSRAYCLQYGLCTSRNAGKTATSSLCPSRSAGKAAISTLCPSQIAGKTVKIPPKDTGSYVKTSQNTEKHRPSPGLPDEPLYLLAGSSWSAPATTVRHPACGWCTVEAGEAQGGPRCTFGLL